MNDNLAPYADLGTTEQASVWARLCLPQQTERQFHTQMGVWLEEIRETLDCVCARDAVTAQALMDVARALSTLGESLKGKEGMIYLAPEERGEFLDGLCDTQQVGQCVAWTLKMDYDGYMRNQVIPANFSKFVDAKPIFDANGKVAKGPHTFKPNAHGYV